MEGYEEVEIKNPLNCGIIKVIKSCNNCKHIKNTLVKSGKEPVYFDICWLLADEPGGKGRCLRNVYGYIEPPGFDGEECPFHKQLLREKSINKLLD